MERTPITSSTGLQAMVEAVNRRHDPRPSVEFGLMYSAQEPTGEVLMGDGMVTDLSPTGLGIRGQRIRLAGDRTYDFSLSARWADPLFVMEAKVAWVSGHRFGVEILK